MEPLWRTHGDLDVLVLFGLGECLQSLELVHIERLCTLQLGLYELHLSFRNYGRPRNALTAHT